MGCASSTSGQNVSFFHIFLNSNFSLAGKQNKVFDKLMCRAEDGNDITRAAFDKKTGQVVKVSGAPERKDDFVTSIQIFIIINWFALDEL